MQQFLIALSVAIMAAAPKAMSHGTDPMATVHQFVDNFNKGDSAAATAACADETSIIDEFTPHEWHGAGACARWLNDYDVDAKKNGITDGVVTLNKPWHVAVAGDRAYIVVPANYTYKKHGKAVKETNSILAIALKMGATGWLMTGWSWAKH